MDEITKECMVCVLLLYNNRHVLAVTILEITGYWFGDGQTCGYYNRHTSTCSNYNYTKHYTSDENTVVINCKIVKIKKIKRIKQ